MFEELYAAVNWESKFGFKNLYEECDENESLFLENTVDSR